MAPSRLLVALTAVLALALTGCPEDDDPAAADPDVEDFDADGAEPEDGEVDEDEPAVRADADLVIWSDELVTAALQPFAEQFSQDNEVEVVVQELPGDQIRDDLIVAGPAGEGPDIITGAHDWLGELVANGVLATVDLAPIADQFEDVAVEGFTFEGLTYGLPYATENIALFRNTDLVPEAPQDWDEVEETALRLQEEGEVEIGLVFPTEPPDPYHNYPMVTAHGGYVFGADEDGDYDPSDIGIDSDGGLEAARAFGDWVDSGLIQPDITHDLMRDLFVRGEAAYMITGPWSLPDLEGMEYEVTTFPEIDGGTPRPFVGVQGFMISAFAENELLAQTFLLDYMAAEDAQVEMFEEGGRPPAHTAALQRVAEDPDIEALGEAAEEGQPMPAIPEMASVWTAWEDAYGFIYEGAVEPDQAFQEAADQVRTLIGEE